MPLDTSGTATFGQTDYTRLEGSPAAAPYVIEAPGVGEGANIGAAFKALREFKGMSLDEVAEATPLPARSVDYDAILDQVDAVLEADAEEYVRSFVQKGGQ